MAYIVMGMMYEPDTYFEGKMEAQVSIDFSIYLQAQKWKKGPGIFDAVFQKCRSDLLKLETGSLEPFCLALVEDKTGFALTSFQLIWKMG